MVHVRGGTASAPKSSQAFCLEILHPLWCSLDPGADAEEGASPARAPALESPCDGLGCWCPPQLYRNSVIAQWRALDLDVLLTPILGPALDLNAPGRATGEACCPSTPLTCPPVSSLL